MQREYLHIRIWKKVNKKAILIRWILRFFKIYFSTWATAHLSLLCSSAPAYQWFWYEHSFVLCMNNGLPLLLLLILVMLQYFHATLEFHLSFPSLKCEQQAVLKDVLELWFFHAGKPVKLNCHWGCPYPSLMKLGKQHMTGSHLGPECTRRSVT